MQRTKKPILVYIIAFYYFCTSLLTLDKFFYQVKKTLFLYSSQEGLTLFDKIIIYFVIIDLSIAMIASVGLIVRKNWGRILMLTYHWISVLFLPLYIWLLIPAQRNLMPIKGVMTWSSLCYDLIFSIGIIIYLNNKNLKAFYIKKETKKRGQ